jgi:hypothetical protein
MAVGGVAPLTAPEGDGVFYGHVVLLKDNAICVLETINTSPLLREAVNEFMFVLRQARIRGTAPMIIDPVAQC